MEPTNGTEQETLMKVGRGLQSRGFMVYKKIKTIMHNACEESLKVGEAYGVERKIKNKITLANGTRRWVIIAKILKFGSSSVKILTINRNILNHL